MFANYAMICILFFVVVSTCNAQATTDGSYCSASFNSGTGNNSGWDVISCKGVFTDPGVFNNVGFTAKVYYHCDFYGDTSRNYFITSDDQLLGTFSGTGVSQAVAYYNINFDGASAQNSVNSNGQMFCVRKYRIEISGGGFAGHSASGIYYSQTIHN